MKVYLASPYQMQPEMKQIRNDLADMGYIVTARWIDVQATDHNHISEEERARWAQEDLADIDAADYFIVFNVEAWHGRGTGGRHVELGYAIARNKIIIYVGQTKENLFHWHPLVKAHVVEHFEISATMVDVLMTIMDNFELNRRSKTSEK